MKLKQTVVMSCCTLAALTVSSLALIGTILACSAPGPEGLMSGTGYSCDLVPTCMNTTGGGDNVETCKYNSTKASATCFDGTNYYQTCTYQSEAGTTDPCMDAPAWPGQVTCD